MKITDLIDYLKQQGHDEKGIAKVEQAYHFAAAAHQGQKRLSGEPFVNHPLEVAYLVSQLELDITSVIAALCHDLIEDTAINRADMVTAFGEEVTLIVEGVTKLSRIDFKSREEQQAENLRKMFLAMSEDLRVIIIKLADRLHNMRTLSCVPRKKQIAKSQETIDIYAPLAHRLGMFRIKWELEDLAFRHLEPDMYEELKKRLQAGRKQREQDIDTAIAMIKSKVGQLGIVADLTGRAKHLYSIYSKMINQDKDFNEIYDLMAVRVIVNNVRECYEVLGVVHEIWKPIPTRFKDYIAVPKSNLYQSLHTTVIGPRGTPLEVQIRSWEMHRTAEYGIAAHWRYKEGNGQGKGDFEKKLAWLRQMLEWQKELQDAQEFMDSLKVDLFQDEVFVFTPKGDVVSLPKGATSIDFAYSIHTEIGHKCVGAKVNGKLMPLEYKLKNGDIVEIVTSKTSSGPSQDWLKMAQTTKARNKIRRHVKKQREQEVIAIGKESLEKELKRASIRFREKEKIAFLEEETKRHGYNDKDELLAAIGFGTIQVLPIVKRLSKQKEDDNALLERLQKESTSQVSREGQGGVQVMGMNDLYVRMSKCCDPLPGDDIIGYITRGRGVSVHRKNCSNVQHLLKDEGRTVPVRWVGQQREAYLVDLEIKALNKSGLLHEITSIINDNRLNLSAVNAITSRDHTAKINMTLEISSLQQLKDLIKKMYNIEGVLSVARNTPN